jgi:hypothetical protein
VVSARRPRADRREVWLRDGRLRLLRGSPQRRRDPFLRHAGGARRGEECDHDRKTHQGKEKWLLHDDYERDLTEKCYADLPPKWGKRLIGAENFLRSHCWTMIVAEVIQSAPEKTSQ